MQLRTGMGDDPMSDRDELIKIMHVAGADYVSADYIHDRRHSDTGTSFTARRILAAGWRKSTVTPEQIEAAIGAGWHEYRYPRPAVDEPDDRFVRGVKAALAQVGLAPEDVTR